MSGRQPEREKCEVRAPREQYGLERSVPGRRTHAPCVQPPIRIQSRTMAANQIAASGGLTELGWGHLFREPVNRKAGWCGRDG